VPRLAGLSREVDVDVLADSEVGERIGAQVLPEPGALASAVRGLRSEREVVVDPDVAAPERMRRADGGPKV